MRSYCVVYLHARTNARAYTFTGSPPHRYTELVRRRSVKHCLPSIIASMGRTQQADWRTRGDTRHPPGGDSRIRTKIIYRFYPRSLRLLRALRRTRTGIVRFDVVYANGVFVWSTAVHRSSTR